MGVLVLPTSLHEEIPNCLLFYSILYCKWYLYNHSGISLLQEVQPYQTVTEPALQDDDVTHHLFVKSVLEELPLLLLEEHLSR